MTSICLGEFDQDGAICGEVFIFDDRDLGVDAMAQRSRTKRMLESVPRGSACWLKGMYVIEKQNQILHPEHSATLKLRTRHHLPLQAIRVERLPRQQRVQNERTSPNFDPWLSLQ